MNEELATIKKHLETAHSYLSGDVDLIKVLTAQVIVQQAIDQLQKLID